MNALTKISSLLVVGLILCNCSSDTRQNKTTEDTPSKSVYFDWINSNWNGSNESKVLANLKFFKWLHDEYGMQLDIYLLDAGNIDNGPNCNGCENNLRQAPTYGGLESAWFRNKFPNSFDSIVALAQSFNCKIGVWIGPDGYGDSDTSAKARIDMLDHLTSKYNIALLKMDACCSNLDSTHEKYFIEAMAKCYSNNPNLIVLNHRINLSNNARKFATTFLWQGAETYIDVSSCNERTAPHHRYTLGRGLPPDMKRLTEDHGVCLSSYLDYWDDDLVLQAFNRNLILAPELYGNPWLLNDEEYQRLAQLFKIHKRYNNILTKAIKLPEAEFGESAVSRGNEHTRFITLRNLGWEPKRITFPIDGQIGLNKSSNSYSVIQYHPTEQFIGEYPFGQQVSIELLPFRTCLIKISSEKEPFIIEGCAYEKINNRDSSKIEINLLAFPGEEKQITVRTNSTNNKNIIIDEHLLPFNQVKTITVNFPGQLLKQSTNRFIGTLKSCAVPATVNSLVEHNLFSTDNNRLEVRSLERSGPTKFKAVQRARDAFFNDAPFIETGAWHKFALDDNIKTTFKVRHYCDTVKPGILRIKLKQSEVIDSIVLVGVPADYKCLNTSISNNLLKKWNTAPCKLTGQTLVILPNRNSEFSYIKLLPAPTVIAEIKAYRNNKEISIRDAKISNLMPDGSELKITNAWKEKFSIDEVTSNTVLNVAVDGTYKENSAFAVVQIGDSLISPFDRSPGYPFNNWEHTAAAQNGNYTFYFRIPASHSPVNATVYVFSADVANTIQQPNVWVTAYPVPFVKKKLLLQK